MEPSRPNTVPGAVTCFISASCEHCTNTAQRHVSRPHVSHRVPPQSLQKRTRALPHSARRRGDGFLLRCCGGGCCMVAAAAAALVSHKPVSSSSHRRFASACSAANTRRARLSRPCTSSSLCLTLAYQCEMHGHSACALECVWHSYVSVTCMVTRRVRKSAFGTHISV